VKILLLSDSKVGKERFIKSLRVCSYSKYHSMNNGIAIKREELNKSRDTMVYNTAGDTYQDWWTGDTEPDVYLRLEARGVK